MTTTTLPAARRMTSRALVFAILTIFVLFFLIPVVWMLLAVTKNATALNTQNPYSFGTWHDLRANWTR